MKKKILITLLTIIIIIQFIRPERNKSSETSANDISRHYSIPENVDAILKRSCNDCHSNNTTYPWYTNLQPVGWWLQYHVNEGKGHLNLSAFGEYAPKRQHHKLEEIIEMVNEGEMPLNTYLWIHDNAKLTKQDQTILIHWANTLKTQIAHNNNLPADEKK